IEIEAEQAGGDLDPAAEWRRRNRTQDHHGKDLQNFRLDIFTATNGPLKTQPVITRFTAFGPLPFLSGSTSKLMCCPSLSAFRPARSTAVMCTNTSRPPSSGLMKP